MRNLNKLYAHYLVMKLIYVRHTSVILGCLYFGLRCDKAVKVPIQHAVNYDRTRDPTPLMRNYCCGRKRQVSNKSLTVTVGNAIMNDQSFSDNTRISAVTSII